MSSTCSKTEGPSSPRRLYLQLRYVMFNPYPANVENRVSS